MLRFLRVFLLINTVILLAACSVYKINGERVHNSATYFYPKLLSSNGVKQFNVRLSAYGNTVGGILVVKSDSMHHQRAALLSDFGNTLLDIELNNDSVSVHYIMPDLDKKIIVHQLTKYFRFLLHRQYAVIETYQSNDRIFYVGRLQKNKVVMCTDQNKNSIRLSQLKGKKIALDIHYYRSGNQLDSVRLTSHKQPVQLQLYPKNTSR